MNTQDIILFANVTSLILFVSATLSIYIVMDYLFNMSKYYSDPIRQKDTLSQFITQGKMIAKFTLYGLISEIIVESIVLILFSVFGHHNTHSIKLS